MTRSHAVLDSPLGPVVATDEDGSLIRFGVRVEPRPDDGERDHGAGCLPAVAEQLASYWRHELREFDLPLAPAGTPFQQQVWAALRTIPYGQTWTYAQLAERIGRPSAVRAAGAANGRNPLWLVVPCHRVIGSSGKLVGYAGGVQVKQALLDHERGTLF